jgi:hypothetical protein
MFFKWLALGKGGVDDVGREPADSSDNAVSIAMAHLNVEHRVFAVEQFFLETVIPYTIITATKCTLLLLKAPDITICTLCHYILPLPVSTRVGHLQGAQCQCLAKVIINYNLLKLC